MNTNSTTKKKIAGYQLLATFVLAPLFTANAQQDNEFGVWTTLEASKKITKKLKLDLEAELRTIEGVDDIERASIGAGASYKPVKWLKASAGYIFIYSQKPETTKLRWDEDINDYETSTDFNGNTFYNYNVDQAYWTERHRFHISLTGEYKIGRIEFSLRERVQYTRTNSATTCETKHTYNVGLNPEEDYWKAEPRDEFKKAKENTTLRSRLTAKWDIPKCKVTPYASVELYTRLDEWKGCDKLRYRLGASYKIDKDNSVSLFYLYQDANDDDEPKGHAIGIGYSVDL